MRRMTMGAALAAAMLLSGCATGVAEPTIGTPVPEHDTEGVGGTALVLQGPDDAQPMLCGWGAEPSPPQCVAGVPLEGWDWSAIEHDANGVGDGATRWGEYRFEVHVGSAVELVGTPIPMGLDDRQPGDRNVHEQVVELLGA